ncbi:nuclear transport factor 2 family protein [Frankia sp. AgPm24]|uniref:nuclear transport factor 2 family protein n=1 Tax=Frankia sp. AgPm24 TaxID=631128 RepID=UPI00200FD3FB|nr:nuclear transport factor 2 family protein [Frankia sp. AgPm24]MCK9920386.1 nuclear transport factor 2 family protein [Frankia sp. AgPm24]
MVLKSADPAGVVQAVTAGVVRLVTGNLTPQERERTLDALADLYAEQTHVRHPLAPLGDQPMRSRAELRAHFAAAPSQEAGIRSFASTDMVVHRTADPEIVIAEFAYAVGTDRGAFTVPCIFVVRVHDGRIVESRDYADSLTFARALGQLPALADALTAENSPPTAETRS